jgi:glycopeptide antibiotics resistance protein
MQWLEEWRGKLTGRSVVERLLYVYLFMLFGYNLLPLDLTISPVEIYHKWRAGRVVLVPFGYHFSDSAQALYGLLADIAVWIPAGYLWRLSAARGSLSSWFHVTLAAALLEFLQIFVYTRVSDVTDVITAAVGGGIGIVLARRKPLATQVPDAAPAGPLLRARRGAVWPVAGLLAWLVVLALVFWYPFDFRFEGGFVRQRIAGLGRVPFEAYYFGTEYRAATEVLHKTLFFAPGGALFALLSLRMSLPLWHRLFGAGAVIFVALTALTIELGQLFLPRKIADLTDWALETLGGVLGYMAASALANRLRGDALKKGGQ